MRIPRRWWMRCAICASHRRIRRKLTPARARRVRRGFFLGQREHGNLGLGLRANSLPIPHGAGAAPTVRQLLAQHSPSIYPSSSRGLSWGLSDVHYHYAGYRSKATVYCSEVYHADLVIADASPNQARTHSGGGRECRFWSRLFGSAKLDHREK